MELARPADVDPQLVGLVRKELIHPAPSTLAGDQAYRFRHLLIRDAAYDGLPKETRAVLHERFGDWLGANALTLIELDEVVGYHLEHAARYHEELGHPRPDLAERAGERLSDAGRRAAERGDTPAGLKLLRRAAELLPERTPLWERTVLDRLTILASVGGAERREAVASLERSEDPRLQMHGRVAELYDAIHENPAEAVERMPEISVEAEELFTQAGDERGLASVWELRAVVAWLGSRANDTLAAAERRAEHAERGGALAFKEGGGVERFGPLFHGPFTPDEIREHFAKLPPEHHVHVVLAGHLAQLAGRYDDAIASSRIIEATFTELGLSVMVTAPLTTRALTLRAAGRLEEARATFEAAIEHERALGLTGFLSTTLIDYGSTLYALGDVDEAERLAVEGERLGGPDDVINFVQGHGLRARIAADRGDDASAQDLARSALEHAYRTDFPATQIGAHEALGHVHVVAGRRAEARAELERALAIAERYGHAATAERLRGLLVEL
jgi:tetratricopeptide (TPR) repeat protein